MPDSLWRRLTEIEARLARRGDVESAAQGDHDLACLLTLVSAVQKVMEYAAHEPACPSAQFQAGEPTPAGGYRWKYADTWYDSTEAVPCECGLKAALAAWHIALEDAHGA